jgi:CBS domain-containing protein
MGVIDIARTNVETASPNTAVADAVEQLHAEGVSGLVLVEDGQPLGLVTDRDLTKALLAEDFDATAAQIGSFVDESTPKIPAESGLYQALETLSQQGVRRGVVVRDGELAGIISISDVVVLLGMELQLVANAIRSSSPAYEREGANYLIE